MFKTRDIQPGSWKPDRNGNMLGDLVRKKLSLLVVCHRCIARASDSSEDGEVEPFRPAPPTLDASSGHAVVQSDSIPHHGS